MELKHNIEYLTEEQLVLIVPFMELKLCFISFARPIDMS